VSRSAAGPMNSGVPAVRIRSLSNAFAFALVFFPVTFHTLSRICAPRW